MFVESKATEGIFRVEAPKHRWVHLATHGFYEPEIKQDAEQVRLKSQAVPGQTSEGGADYSAVLDHEGLKSGLALAGANERNREGLDDGILSAMEVSSMDLSNVEMTMLSACQTGLGASLSGEGVAGLQRAFQVAGVRSTVTTLWSVNDTAARLLAARFYRNLWEKKMNKAAAMREAQSWMIAAAFRDDGKHEVPDRLTIDSEVLPGRFRLPENWAPFVLSGDWR
jgi:CHAT domain-containing protein